MTSGAPDVLGRIEVRRDEKCHVDPEERVGRFAICGKTHDTSPSTKPLPSTRGASMTCLTINNRRVEACGERLPA